MIYYNDDDLDNPSIAPFIESAMRNNPFYEEIHEKENPKKIQKESCLSDDDKYIMQFLREAYGDNVDENSIMITEKVDVQGELIDIGRILTDPVNLLTGLGKNAVANFKWLKADMDVAKKDGKKYNPMDMKRTYKVIKSHNDRALKLAIDRTNDSTTLVYMKRIIKMVRSSCMKYQNAMMRYEKEGSAGIYNSVVKDMKEFGITQKDLETTIKNLDKLYQDTENKIVELRSRKKKKSVKENSYDEWLEENLDNDGEDNVASESPVSFVSQKSKPVKNQKAHLRYIKKKAHDNPTNNATGQKEMPSANSFNI